MVTIQDITALTNEFFTSGEADIIDFHVAPFSSEKLGYLGKHELLTIKARVRHGDSGESKKSLTFFVKSMVPNCDAFDKLIFQEESKFFRDVVPQLLQGYNSCPWAAKCYLVKHDILVLEDLRSQGFRVTCPKLQVNQLKSALMSVARLHACSILLEENLQKPLSDVYPGFFGEKVFVNDGGFAWKWLMTGANVIEAVARNLQLDPKHVLTAYELMLKKIKPVEGQRNVLCHSDLWSNNMMFNESDNMSCRLVDFQMVSYMSYVVDLIQLIYLNSTRDDRCKFEKEFVGVYHAVLQENLRNHGIDDSKIISLEEIFRDVEDRRICGLVTAVQFFPISLLSKKSIEEYTKDPERLKYYMYTSRKELVLKTMEMDSYYRSRIEEAVRELIEFMDDR